ncbi:MAG: hypothetical protein U0165_10500 [Polyangiaceae bacterium]
MSSCVGLTWKGDGRLFSLTHDSVACVLSSVIDASRLGRHELSLFHVDDERESGGSRVLARALGRAGRSSELKGTGLSNRELHRVAGLLSSNVLAGRWRVCREERKLHGSFASTAWGRRRIDVLLLYGLAFELEPIRFTSVLDAPPGDYVIERVDRSFQVVYFEGLTPCQARTARESTRNGALPTLGYSLRERGRLSKQSWFSLGASTLPPSAPLRWYTIRRTSAQEGFALLDAKRVSLGALVLEVGRKKP